jgi:methionyl-tRNA formyltransferase
MRLVMMGTGPFAVPTFRGLFQTHHTVAALVTGPIKRRGKRPIAVSPCAMWRTSTVSRSSIPRASTRRNRWRCSASTRRICTSCATYGQILSADCLATARLGGINLHASLLPKYRGAAPINWAIYDGEEETGRQRHPHDAEDRCGARYRPGTYSDRAGRDRRAAGRSLGRDREVG